MIDNNMVQNLTNSATGSQWKTIGIKNHHGIALPLFSLHSNKSCGIGEYLDLIPLIDWCQSIGFDVIQLLPLNDTGLETSPYSALSAYALNPIFLSLSQLPGGEETSSLKRQITELQIVTNRTQRVDYKSVQQRKDFFLREYYRLHGANITNQEDFKKFTKDNDFWLPQYALFKSIKIQQGWSSWEQWPVFDPPPSDVNYHIFIQYLCFKQFASVKKHAEEKGVFLKGDIPILINRESADAWHHRNFFLLDLAAGAPPDMYSQEGQKWGFPLYNWDALASENYRWWIERLTVAANLYHIYRIDHIVGFFRIWAIPLSRPARDGHFVPEDRSTWIKHGETIMKVMVENSSMLPIGEDLGTVPPEVRVSLRNLGICGTKVMRWERRWEGDKSFIDPKEYIAESMTTVSTHDSETLEMWWKNQSEEAKLYANSVGWTYTPTLSKKQRFDILNSSHKSGSLFHINLLQEYLALFPEMVWPNPEDERINLPGVISDKNWSYRFLPSIEQIVSNEKLKQDMIKMISP